MGCRTPEELAALQYVLERYFALDGDVYRHERCDEELERMRVKSEKAVASGRKGGMSPRASRKAAGAKRTPSERLANAKQTLSESEADAKRMPSERQATQYPIPIPNTPDGVLVDAQPAAAPPTEPPPAPPPPAPAPEARSRPSRKCPEGFEVSAAMVAWAARKVPLLTPQDIERQTEKFRNHTYARAITDWAGAWRNWLYNEQEKRELQLQRAPVVAPRAAQHAKRDQFINAVLGKQHQGEADARDHQGFFDVESRVVGGDADDAAGTAD